MSWPCQGRNTHARPQNAPLVSLVYYLVSCRIFCAYFLTSEFILYYDLYIKLHHGIVIAYIFSLSTLFIELYHEKEKA